jgi:DMSO/TMAO reductase YedYZ molybdopterin-dependent catalytic subunit
MKFDFFRRLVGNKYRADRLPPGQSLVNRWPVLTYGSTPRVDLSTWRFQIGGLVEDELILSWDAFMALPQATVVSDIHCVTGWSTYDNLWQGVAVKELLQRVRLKPAARHVMIQAHGRYTTNIPLADLLDDDVLLAHSHGGQPLTPEHGWPLRLVVPKLYFWKSAKWVCGFELMADDRPGFWEFLGYHMRGDPWKEERYV